MLFAKFSRLTPLWTLVWQPVLYPWPVEAPSNEICQKLDDTILQDRRVKVSVIAHELGFSAGIVSSIIHSVLMMSKVSFRCVPWMLTPEQKAWRQKFSEENLDIFRANLENFFSRIIAGDETWVYHHDPETKKESMQWKHKGSPTPKKFRVQQSAG